MLVLTSLTCVMTLTVWLCSTEVGPASMIVGNLVAGKRIAQACGRDVAQLEDNDQARKVVILISSTHHLHTNTADTGKDPYPGLWNLKCIQLMERT